MADISQYLQDILDAIYGEDVRNSIHDAIEIINDVSEVVLATGTAVTSASSSSTGFFTDSLYLNTNTYELWKCIGTDSWQSLGILKGDAGSPGQDGNKWYRSSNISGKSPNPTVYSSSGITEANAGDLNLNVSEGAVYHCVTGGDASTATWSYDFTMTGGGGSGDTVSWNQIQTSTGSTKIAEISINGFSTDVYAPSGGGGSYTAGNGIDSTDLALGTITLDYGTVSGSNTTKPVTGKAVNDSLPTVYDGTLTIQQNGTSKATFSANTSSSATANIITDSWFGTSAQIQSDNTVTFTGVDDTDNNGYDLYCNNKLIGITALSVTGNGTSSATLVYTTSGGAQGDVCYLRIIK